LFGERKVERCCKRTDIIKKMSIPKDLRKQLEEYKLAWDDEGFAFGNEFVTWDLINKVNFSFRFVDNLGRRSFLLIPNLTGRIIVNYSDNKTFKDLIEVNQGFIKKLSEKVPKEKTSEDINKFLLEGGLESQYFRKKLRGLRLSSYLINLIIGFIFVIFGYLLSGLFL
jgi:hypothetical protein